MKPPTLRQWLADARKPDRLGINARAWLKRIPRPPYDSQMFHIAIGMGRNEIRKACMAIATRESKNA